MKRWTILIVIALLLGGCSGGKAALENEDSIIAGFPAAVQLLNALGIEEKDIKILVSDENSVIFALYYDGDEKISDYLSQMVKEEYKQTIYDATISSTIRLENRNQQIGITMISDLEDFKHAAEYKSQEYRNELDNIRDINMLVEVNENGEFTVS